MPISQVTKFMCTVETKNYPVISIIPHINRYGTIRKKLTISEIANCLASYALVTLHKDNGNNVKLNAGNYRQILTAYKAELETKSADKTYNKQLDANAKALEKIKTEEAPTPKTSAKKSVAKPATPVVEEPPVVEEKPVVVKEEEKKEDVLTDTESIEEAQPDPENPDTADWSHIYGEETEEEK